MSPLKVWSLEPRHLFAKVLLTLAACTTLVGTSASWAQQRPAPDPEYIQFLEQQSMLFQADQDADSISGMGIQWREDFGLPEPLQLVQTASVWLLYYPGSVITKP